MKNQTRRKIISGSIEDTSILRKFTVLFLLMSVIPMTVLYYFYVEIKNKGYIEISEQSFNVALIFIVLGVMLGYGTMRNVLKAMIDLANANRKALESVITPEKIKEISGERNEITVLAKTFSAITEKLEENVRTLEVTKRTLHSVMSRVGKGISSMQNIDTFLELIVETVTEAISAKIGLLMLHDPRNDTLQFKTVYGEGTEELQGMEIPLLKNSTLKKVFDERKPKILTSRVGELSDIKDHGKVIEPPMIIAPLVIHNTSLGLMIVCGRKVKENYEKDELYMLYNLAVQTAVAIENSKLSQDMEKTYFETISALALAVDAKDKYSRGHLDRVADYCVRIGKQLGLDDTDLKTLHDAAKLHDIGKIGIPDDILGKQGPLNVQEWSLMEKHPEIGESIIKPIRSLNHLCDIVRHHHEKLDGSGYPDGLKGEEITPLVRITAIADIYDSLTSERPYRQKMSQEKAFKELKAMGEKIDQDIVEALIEALTQQQQT